MSDSLNRSAVPSFLPLSKKPIGLPTRGKTAPNRLRRTDVFLAICYGGLVRHLSGWYVDLGFGENPATTIETYARLGRLNPDIQLLGVEIDPERVAAAIPHKTPRMEFRLGGFNLPLRKGECAAFIRAMNVLRQYPESEHASAITRLASHLERDGIILEGTSNPPGSLMTFNVYQREEDNAAHKGVVFSVSFRGDFSPRDLQTVLPKNCIHHAEPGSPLDRFFESWERNWLRARTEAESDPKLRFSLAARRLSEQDGYAVDLRPTLLRRGFLRLHELPADWFQE